MSSWPTITLSLLIGICGWYYLFYSRAAHRLQDIEADAINKRRIRYRRTNGALMLLLATLIYAGARAVDYRMEPRLFAAIWLGAFASLFGVVYLALIDLRLTLRLRGNERRP